MGKYCVKQSEMLFFVSEYFSPSYTDNVYELPREIKYLVFSKKKKYILPMRLLLPGLCISVHSYLDVPKNNF